MIHIPVLRWGEPYKSLDVDKVVHFATGEPLAEVSRANGGLVERDMRHAKRARDVLREIPIAELMQDDQEGGRLLHRGRAAPGRRHADARPVRAHAIGHHRAARAHVPVQHEEEPLRAQSDGQDARRSDARPRPEHPVARLRRRSTAACRSAIRRSRRCWAGAAQQFARRAHALAADHPDAGRPGTQAGPAGTVDAVPHGASLLQAGIPKQAISIYPGLGDVGAAVLAAVARAA